MNNGHSCASQTGTNLKMTTRSLWFTPTHRCLAMRHYCESPFAQHTCQGRLTEEVSGSYFVGPLHGHKQAPNCPPSLHGDQCILYID